MNPPSSSRAVAMAIGMFAITMASCQRTEGARVRQASVIAMADGRPGLHFELLWPRARATPNDALWIFAKYRTDGGAWQHARLDPSRFEPPGGAWTFTPALDGTGTFLGADTTPASWTTVEVPLTAQPAVVTDVRVLALEMIRVGIGPFAVGDGEVVDLTGHFQIPELGTPYPIRSEHAITLGADTTLSLGNSNAYGMDGEATEAFLDRGVRDDFADTSRIVLPDVFPKGFAAFYMMKYELSQREYAEFLNLLPDDQAAARDPDGGRLVPGRYRYRLVGAPARNALVPDRAMNMVSWMDLAAYADWAALRPMTELEFEKAARGPLQPVPGQFSWGTERVTNNRYSLVDADTPAEAVANLDKSAGNASWRMSHGELDPSCWSCIAGPLRGGAFGSGPFDGSSYYTVYDLSGNLYERVVTIGHATGRRFAGRHGNGQLSPGGNAAGPEIQLWPGATRRPGGFEVTGARGSGLRGGSWASPRERLRTSDRALAATPDSTRSPIFGIRLVRTAPSSR